jgi:hypothetical protein
VSRPWCCGSSEGISEIARASGLSREHLYRSFSEKGNPTLKSMLAVMEALGVRLPASAITSSATTTKQSANAVKHEAQRKMRLDAKSANQRGGHTRSPLRLNISTHFGLLSVQAGCPVSLIARFVVSAYLYIIPLVKYYISLLFAII